MTDWSKPPQVEIHWRRAVRIIRSSHPPIDLFEDIADPADWSALIAAEQKTNPRLMETIGNLDLIPIPRRVSGPGASWLMAPFTHVSRDRPSRFSDGGYGVLYAGNTFEVALFETIYHHSRFLAATAESAGWSSQFREIRLDVNAQLCDLRDDPAQWHTALDANDYRAAQTLGAGLRSDGADGLVYPSVRYSDGECVGLFYPDLASQPNQGRHLHYHWDGERVDLYRDAVMGQVYRISG